jgi:restriction system protein
MSIPDFQKIMRPLIEAHTDGEEHRNRDLVSQLADHFGLTAEERREMLPSGGARLFDNRVGWAKTHVMRAGLLSSPRRAISVITQRGQEMLSEHPEYIDMKALKRFEEYRTSRSRKAATGTESVSESQEMDDDAQAETPEEMLEHAYLKVRRQVEGELLSQVLNSSPDFLERVVVDLVVRMGYGGDRKDAGEALGGVGDEGIDGIIKEDPLGLDIIYLQAKRWEGAVSRPEIQKFAGALQGKRAKKGIFITTSTFTKGAIEYVELIDSKIILIDGPKLAKLMFDHGVGVAPGTLYEVKKIDSDYFDV